MTTKEKLTRRIIELIHDLPWEEAIKKEPDWCNDENDTCYHKPIITIGRVMQAFKNKEKLPIINNYLDIKGITFEYKWNLKNIMVHWQLLNDDGSECTLDSQSKETIKALYNLLKIT